MKIFKEIHRRSLWQVLGIYIVGAWVAFQVAQTLTEGMGLPDWVPPVALILLVVGLPIVLSTAVVQKGGPTRKSLAARPFADPERPDATSPGTGASTADAPASVSAPPSAATGAHHRLLTWRNAIAGGVLAFALLGVGTFGWMAMRTLGIGPAGTLVAKGVLDERERILVADFASTADDEGLATAVSEAFRVDLSQSPTVDLVPQDRVATVLGRMNRDPGDRMEIDLAREVAQRDGIKAVLAGQVDRAGSGYVLTANLIASEDGQILASARESASGPDEVIGAIDKLSRQLRERIGESMRSIRGSLPLESVATSSLDALRLYSQAERAHLMQGEGERAVALLEDAVARDSTFAMAWRKLGVVLGNRGIQRSRSVEALERALANAERLPDRDRLLTVATYHSTVTGDYAQVTAAYENLLEIYPDESFALHNLGVANNYLRDFERSAEFFEAAYAVDSIALSLRNLAQSRAAQGRWADAYATLEDLRSRFPDYYAGAELDAWFAAAQLDHDAARGFFEQLGRDYGGNEYQAREARYGLVALDATEGRLSNAVDRIEEAGRVSESSAPPQSLRAGAYGAMLRAVVAEDPEGAIDLLETALARIPLESMDPSDRPYMEVGTVYALAGRIDRATELLAEFESAVPSGVMSGFAPKDHFYFRAEIALAEGRFDDALNALDRADEGFCMVCADAGRARVHRMAGQTAEAIAAYERYLTTVASLRLGAVGLFGNWVYGDWLFLGPTYEGLGQLYDEQDDLESAAKYYAMFVELWAEADEELQPRVAAAQARLQQIVEARG